VLLREGLRRRAKNHRGIAESDEVAVNLPANSFTQGNHGRQRTERGRFRLTIAVCNDIDPCDLALRPAAPHSVYRLSRRASRVSIVHF